MNPLLRIESLTINNFATIKNQGIHFSDGFNVIVGETGSGKSLILDALQLAFGSRADKKLVRKGSSFATIEVEFSISKSGLRKVQKFCDELGFPLENSVHIKRVIYKEGSSKAFLNHQSCPISILNAFTRKFIDLVGQFENQKLLSPDYQLRLLDSYASLEDMYRSYSSHYELLKESEKKLNSLLEKFQNREREIDYLQFQLNEFDELNPTEERELTLIKEKESLLNAEALNKVNQEFRYILLEENDGGILSKLRSLSSLASNGLPNQEVENIRDKINLSEELLLEAEELINQFSTNAENSDDTLDDILDELDRYQKLKRKFNLSTEELSEKEAALREDLGKFLSIEEEIRKITTTITAQKELCLNVASELHKLRVDASKNLSVELTKTVQKLNMDGAQIEFLCNERGELSSNGLTELALNAQTNPGEGFYKLSDIASGGELSRILLSLRYLMTSQDSISIFLFDEIDTGIGGKTATKIGDMLEDISRKSQVIAITHLPQIASFAKNLISVEKKTSESRTESKIEVLSGKKKESYIKEMSQINL